jgi:pheromone alpha factor receptor
MSPIGSFDPYSQNVTFYLNDGVTPCTVAIPDIDQWLWYSVNSSINYGAQLGACAVMFIVTACLTRNSQRYKPVHILNLLSLILGLLRALLLNLFFTSPWREFYSFFSLDSSHITRSVVANSIAGTVMPLLMSITVNMSLVLQAHTVCKVMQRKYYYAVWVFACIFLLLAIGFRFAECITNSLTIMSAGTYFSQDWIATGALITETASIWFFSLIFTWKLFFTIRMRRKMGWSYPNPMEILLIMGGCTMIIPCKNFRPSMKEVSS